MRWVPCFFTYTGSFTGFAGTRKKSKAMCQLLGMNCNTPTDVRFSFSGFSQRAGNTGDHTDGWGIAFFEDKGLRHFVDHERAIDSPIAKLIRDAGLKGVRTQVQGEELRVFSKSRDDLQTVQKMVREADYDFAVQFDNYR